MKYLVLDLETSIKNRGEEAVGKMKAAPWYHENKIVMAGTKDHSEDDVLFGTTTALPLAYDLFIGHNIKFDLHYLMVDNKDIAEEVLPRINIWDTQLVEYILTGQRSMYPKLDDCSAKYGGSIKDDRIKKDYWDNNIDTEDIPEDMLKEYLENDVRNTELVFLSQYQLVNELGMMPLVMSQMRALKATIEMEFNGMHFDKHLAGEIAATLLPELTELRHAVEWDMKKSGIVEANCNSGKHVGIYLFGGEHTYTAPVPQLDPATGDVRKYKSGKRKGGIVTKNEKVTKHITGILDAEPEHTESGEISVSDSALSKYDNAAIKDILKIRKLSKDLNTYYIGYSDLVWGRTGLIHHSLNHCSTATGRLSCTSPNLQNTTTES